MDEKILIVDDEQSILTVLSKHLESEGYETATADSVQRALMLFGELDPAVVIADIKMPSSSGIDLLRAIREISQDTPVILMGGHAELI